MNFGTSIPGNVGATTIPIKIATCAMILLTLMAAPICRALGEVAQSGAEVGKWTMDFEAAEKLAKEKDLPMLLNFTGSDWCGWCKLMDRNVFAQAEWQEFAAKNVVLVTLDFPKDESIVPKEFVARNEALQERFQVRGYPTYVILDSDGKTELGRLGAGREATPASFIKDFEGVVAKRRANVEAKVKSLGLVEGQRYRAAIKAVEDAEADLERWLERNPPRTPANEAKFEKLKAAIEKAREEVAKF